MTKNNIFLDFMDSNKEVFKALQTGNNPLNVYNLCYICLTFKTR